MVVMELVTGKSYWPEEDAERLRGVVRDGSAAAVVDRRMRLEGEWKKEVMECLKVVYLCTAKSSEKRLVMRQVVALLKDIRPDGSGGGNASPTY